MKEYIYDYLVLIGRFQPFHDGHLEVLKIAFEKAENVIVLVGSANVHRSTDNPWTFNERADVISASVSFSGCMNAYQDLYIKPLNDYKYNDTAWTIAVQETVNNTVNSKGNRIGLIGFDKDSTSYYLKMFPTWDVEEIPCQFGTLNSTQVRNDYFRELPRISEFCPQSVRSFLKKFAMGEDFKYLLSEYNYIRHYHKIWENAPFPPVFVTVDPVVVQSSNILLVRRKEAPYKGSLALPGGFLNVNETLENAVVRELKEETKISDSKGELPPAMLKSFITKREVFDDPTRSKRGRTITHAFLFELPKKEELYKVIGSDDAEHADWYDLTNLKTCDFMEDHAFIIQKMLGIKF